MSTRTRPRPTPSRAPEARPAPVVGARRATWALVAVLNAAVLTNVLEPFQLVKAVVLVVGAVVLAGAVVWELIATGAALLPNRRIAAAAGAFVGLLALSTLANGNRLHALFGDYGRSTGLLVYAAAVLVLLAVVRTHRAEDLPSLGLALLAGSVPVMGFALLQLAGFQPLGLTSSTSDVVGTLGQANFVAGYAGIALPLALWAALHWRRDVLAGLAFAAWAVAIVVVGLGTKSFQAIPAMGAGALVVVLAFLGERGGKRAVLSLVTGLVAIVLIAGVAGHDYLDRQVREGMDERVLLWEAGRDIVVDHPVLGTGPVGYVTHFGEARPAVHARKYGFSTIADNPHDVPLWMFVSGGVPLGLLYLALVGLTAMRLGRGLTVERGDRRLLLAGFGGAWVAYQVQSLVSIENAALLVAGVATTGAIWILAGRAEPEVLRAPGLAATSRGRGLVRSSTAVRAGVAVVVLLAAWLVTLPLRADAAHRRSLEHAAAGLEGPALDQARSAHALAPWDAQLSAGLAAMRAQTGDAEGAYQVGWLAARQLPSFAPYALTAGQAAHDLGRDDEADRAYRFAIDHAPTTPESHAAYGDHLLAVDRPADAVRQYRRAIELRPEDYTTLDSMATALEKLGRRAEAVRAWRRALELHPGDGPATTALAAQGG